MRTWRRKKQNGMVMLQLTSMVDMFTIILVFLLKSYTTSAVQLTPADDLNLAVSATGSDVVEGLKVAVSKKGVLIEDELVLEWKDAGKGSKKKKRLLKPVYDKLLIEANKSKEIAKANPAMKFEGKAVVQVDREVPYSRLKQVMYSSTIAGYADFRLVAIDAQ